MSLGCFTFVAACIPRIFSRSDERCISPNSVYARGFSIILLASTCALARPGPSRLVGCRVGPRLCPRLVPRLVPPLVPPACAPGLCPRLVPPLVPPACAPACAPGLCPRLVPPLVPPACAPACAPGLCPRLCPGLVPPACGRGSSNCAVPNTRPSTRGANILALAPPTPCTTAGTGIHEDWADLREDKKINPAPDFSVGFRPSGAHGGPRRPRDWIRFENGTGAK